MTDLITVVGNIATDPTPSALPDGTPVLRLRVATNRRKFDRAADKWVDDAPNWYTVIAYRSLATHGAASFSKGQRVIATGRLRIRTWETDAGGRGTDVEILAEALGADVLFGTVSYHRSDASSPGAEQRRGAGEPAGNDQATDDEWAPAPLAEAESVPF